MNTDYWLRVEEEGTREIVPIVPEGVTIGRGAENTVVVADRRSSRHHCRVLPTPQGLLLEDLGSRNGTVLAGTTVSRTIVQPGDEFRIGNASFTIGTGTVPADPPPRPRRVARRRAQPHRRQLRRHASRACRWRLSRARRRATG